MTIRYTQSPFCYDSLLRNARYENDKDAYGLYNNTFAKLLIIRTHIIPWETFFTNYKTSSCSLAIERVLDNGISVYAGHGMIDRAIQCWLELKAGIEPKDKTALHAIKTKISSTSHKQMYKHMLYDVIYPIRSVE